MCAVTVRIISVGDPGTDVNVRFRKPPLIRLVVGTTAKLVRLPLSREQRRGLAHSTRGTSVGAVVTASRAGVRTQLLTDSLFCTRADPCG